jgi:hypothetical protein
MTSSYLITNVVPAGLVETVLANPATVHSYRTVRELAQALANERGEPVRLYEGEYFTRIDPKV